MIRNFARINSIPHYQVEYKDDGSTPEMPTTTTSRMIPPLIPPVLPQGISPDNFYEIVATPKTLSVMNPHDEYQYLNLINDILQQNNIQSSRNGNTLFVFGAAMVFSLDQGTIPILTTKQMAWKTCLKELLWFIQGKTDNRILQQSGVHIWDDNASRDFLDSRGLTGYAEGDLGPVYGHQWRHFNAKYENCDTDYTGKGIDQLAEIIRCLKHPTERFSRRLIMSAWNPCQGSS
jgi:thymidylate synthase